MSLNQSGQTMVDLIVALALISGSVASAGVLSTTSSKVARDSGHRTQAIGLAEREIEGLRAYRDSFERLGVVDWNSTLLGTAGCSYFTMRLNTGTGEWDTVTAGGVPTQVTYTTQNGGDSSLATNYEGFSRIIETCPSNDFQQTDHTSRTPTGTLNTIPNSSHIRYVNATINWVEGTATKQLTERTIIGDYAQ